MIKRILKCRICKSSRLTRFLSFGKIPLPNGFLQFKDLKKKETTYPLSVGLCLECGLVQLMEIVDAQTMFHNYVYIPSSSSTRMKNFSEIAEQARDTVSLNKSSLVIDIGSNDGSLLSFFKGYGIRTLGIDPAENLAKVAELKGITTLNELFSRPLAKKIVEHHGSAHVITATNVVAHIEDLHELFSAIKLLLHQSGVFICEFPYLVDLLEKKLFDTIYHEHLSYLSVKPLLKLIKKHDLKLVGIKRTAIDGGALRLTIARADSNRLEATSVIQELLQLETKLGLDQPQTYFKFAREVTQLKKSIQKTLFDIKNKGHRIVGYGASARGNILLSYCDIDHKTIDFMVDSTTYKQGLYTPGHHIPIFPEEMLQKDKPNYTLILAWNFANEIMQKQAEYSIKGGAFIIPVPKVKIVKTLRQAQTKKLKVVMVMPAYNAAKTIKQSYKKIPKGMVDEIILVDDASQDNTFKVAQELPITVFRNKQNLGYGGNLKVCLTKALQKNADVIIEYHPDDQYDPKDVLLFIEKAIEGYDFALGSRFIFPKEALTNKMPLSKFVANRGMSFIDQLVLGIEISEFHSGFRMYTRRLLEKVPFHQNSDDYLFSFEIIVQAVFWKLKIAEIPISCRYHPAMHTANLYSSTLYALGTFKTLGQYVAAKFFRLQRGPFLLIQPPSCPQCKKKLTRFESVIRDATNNEQFSIFFCTYCQLGFTLPTPKDLSRYYPKTYYSELKTLVYKTLQNRRPKIVRRILKKGKVLDIGCGDGSLSQTLDPARFSYTGIETKFANSRNPLVKSIGVENMQEPRNKYDLAMFWESLEHLKNPQKTLKKVYSSLVSKGYLIIECPDYLSWERSLFGSQWFHLDPPRHLFHYTQKGLAYQLNEIGFEVIQQKRIYAFEYIPVGLAQSILYKVSPKLNIFRKHKQKYNAFIVGTLLATIAIAMIPISLVFYAFNGSPILLTVARKKT